MKLCKNCAHEIDNNLTICPFCGSKVINAKDEIIAEEDIKQEYANEENFEGGNTKKPFVNYGFIRGPYNKYISITLCILLGFLGGHKFYEGKYFVGLLYAFTFGCWGVGIVFDLINLIRKPKYYYVSTIPLM